MPRRFTSRRCTRTPRALLAAAPLRIGTHAASTLSSPDIPVAHNKAVRLCVPHRPALRGIARPRPAARTAETIACRVSLFGSLTGVRSHEEREGGGGKAEGKKGTKDYGGTQCGIESCVETAVRSGGSGTGSGTRRRVRRGWGSDRRVWQQAAGSAQGAGGVRPAALRSEFLMDMILQTAAGCIDWTADSGSGDRRTFEGPGCEAR